MLVSVVQRMPQFRRCAATCSTALLKRHFPDQLAQENAAPPQKYLGRLADLVQEARHAKSHAGMRGKRSKATGRTGNEYGEMPCTACGKYFPQAMFAKGGCWCKGCSAAKFRKYHRTLCGSASVLVNSARRKSRAKGWHCGIDQADIFEMLLEQGGRCHYSSVPMEILFPNSNWRMSLERFNNSDGYFRQNCALVAAEFNSSDFSRAPGVKKEDVEGSAQWSAEKFHFVCNAFNSIVDLDMLQKHVTHALGKPFLSGPSSCCLRIQVLQDVTRQVEEFSRKCTFSIEESAPGFRYRLHRHSTNLVAAARALLLFWSALAIHISAH